jgi:hypothetical protein
MYVGLPLRCIRNVRYTPFDSQNSNIAGSRRVRSAFIGKAVRGRFNVSL